MTLIALIAVCLLVLAALLAAGVWVMGTLRAELSAGGAEVDRRLAGIAATLDRRIAEPPVDLRGARGQLGPQRAHEPDAGGEERRQHEQAHGDQGDQRHEPANGRGGVGRTAAHEKSAPASPRTRRS